ncbi:Lrp/AsnC family transcriptional regulator [Brevibacterium salitolerans]|uniref:Lrp/AsnC family transcriptional regulator n=1 Tax=Brevibacterium salitolerans TaxID=1403566 RepID=A0ABP5IFQ1_9MICO
MLGSDPGGRTEVPAFTESDLALIDAMQEGPRAAWSDVGRRIGASAATARRRWERLSGSGLAWIVTQPGRASGTVVSIIDLACGSDSVAHVGAALTVHPQIIQIAEVTGSFALSLIALTPDLPALRRLLRMVAEVPGVEQVRPSVGTVVYRDGSHMRTGALPGTSGSAPPNAASRETLQDARPRAVLRALETEGRAPSTALAQALGVSQAHARRYTRSLFELGVLSSYIDVAQPATGWPYALVLQMTAPAASLDRTVAAVSALPRTRLCLALSGGPHNLHAVVWLSHVRDAVEFEARITASHEVQVAHRGVVLHYHKRGGSILDEDGRRTSHLPWTAPLPAELGASPLASGVR